VAERPATTSASLALLRDRLADLTVAVKDPVMSLALLGLGDLVQHTFSLLVAEAYRSEEAQDRALDRALVRLRESGYDVSDANWTRAWTRDE
jgi:hypothetical protein